MTRQRPQAFAMRSVLMLLALLIACHLSLVTALAQTSTATLSGTVTDPNGAVVPGVTVTITDPATRLQRTATTNDAGQFVIPLLPPSKYNLTLEHAGFMTAAINDVTLNVNDQRALTIKMKLGDVKETVNVTGEAPLINESPAVGTIVDRHFVENLPLNGRSFQTLIMLTPGVVLTPASVNNLGQFSVNGQRANANYFMVDGASANVGVSLGVPAQTPGGTVPGFGVTGGTNNLVSVDAMQEFRIQTSSFAPEFGRTPGGQISISTRSGTNQFHATAFEYFRNDKLDANNWFTNRSGLPRAPERQNQFGGVFHGPIFKNKTFFFFSYEGLRLRQPRSATTVVPSTASANPALNRQAAPAQIQPFLNAYAIPNGPDLGNGFAQFNASYSDPSTLNASSARVDHVINSKLSLFARYNYSPSAAAVRSTTVASEAETLIINTHTFTLGLTQILSPQISNEFRANLSNIKGQTSFFLDNFGGAVPLTDSQTFPVGLSSSNSQFIFTLSGAGTLVTGENTTNEQRQLNFVDNLSVIRGSHQVKLGVDYRWLAPIFRLPSYGQSVVFTGMTGARGALGGIASSAATNTSQGTTALVQNLSFYSQDTWKVVPRLTLTYGLRWELNPALKGKDFASEPYPVQGIANPATMTIGTRGSQLYATTYGNFAPRFGAAYQLRQSPDWSTILRGGFGVFYDLGDGFLGNYPATFPFTLSKSLSNVPFPLTPAQAAPPVFVQPPPMTSTFYAADPNLKLPRTYQWNVAIEQSFGSSQTLSATYVGALGRKLIRNDSLVAPNANFTSTVFLIRNTGTSDYHALQLQFQRRLARGFQALASYTWSHSIDTASTDAPAAIPSSTIFPLSVDRASSDFDVRHSFSAAITYNIPVPARHRIARAILGNWSIDDLLIARSALPVNVTGSSFVVGGTQFTTRPNLVPGIPLYLYGPQFPGGRAINFTANQGGVGCKGPFCPPAIGTLGSLGRNALRGFGAWQDNFSVRRQFHITEKYGLQFRAEFFNIFNHPNFGPPTGIFASALFGQSTLMLSNSLGGSTGGLNPLYQIGGPRSIQFALKFSF